MLLVTEWFGAFLLEGGRVREARAFPRDPAALAERLQAIDRGEVLAEERALAGQAQPLEVGEGRLLALPGARLARAPAPSVRGAAAEHGFDDALLRDAVLEFGRRQAQAALGGRDQHVVQAVQAVDDLAEVANQVAERLREWYGLHFPESDRLIERHEELAGLVSKFGPRDAVLEGAPHLRLARPSFGAALGEEELAAVRGLARVLSSIYAQRAEVDKYLELAMPDVAPNVTQLVGPAIAARLLFHAGGLHGLARMSSGTVQTLGAEKALFRHLKEGNRPPKHGVIFQHPLIHRAPHRQRGALARSLAGKIAIAARADAYTHRALAAELQKDLDARVSAVKAAGPRRRPGGAPPRAPPPREGPPPRGGGKGGRPPPWLAKKGPRPGPPPGRGPPPQRGDRDHDRRDRPPRRHPGRGPGGRR